MACIFYILGSEALSKFYIGHTCQDLQNRINKHLTDYKEFTSKAKDWRLFYSEDYATKAFAYAREREVKSWQNSKRIAQLV